MIKRSTFMKTVVFVIFLFFPMLSTHQLSLGVTIIFV